MFLNFELNLLSVPHYDQTGDNNGSAIFFFLPMPLLRIPLGDWLAATIFLGDLWLLLTSPLWLLLLLF